MNSFSANIVDPDDPIPRYFVEPGIKAEVWALKPSPFKSKLLEGSAGLEFENLLGLTAADTPGEGVHFAGKCAFAAGTANGGFEAELALPVGGQERVRLALVVVNPQAKDKGGCALANRNYPLNPSTSAEVELN